jgi:hypothetical protein
VHLLVSPSNINSGVKSETVEESATNSYRNKFHYVTLAPETNSGVKSETVTKLNQTKCAMSFLDSDDTSI